MSAWRTAKNMKRYAEKHPERGSALIVAMFTLMLLSVVGLGMMYATNMETSINANYRDKQQAVYAAVSGLQEARDRLQPAAPSIALPTALPTLTNEQVIYIINPRSGETVAPWDIGNAYRDTELCQEGILGLTPTPGIPCAELPSGTDWYRVVDNSDAASAPWNASTPLDMKWTRITLKGNNMTPVKVNGNSADATQTCWDGAHQILRPAGYSAACTPDGSVAAVTVTSGGTGYSSTPNVTFGAPPAGGTQATGTAALIQLSSGQLSSISVVSGGAGYTTAPIVSFSGGSGTGASATAVIVAAGSPVASVSLTTPGGRCYSGTPPVSFAGGGSGATAAATLDETKSCVASWTVTGACSSRKGTTKTDVELSGGGGSGFLGSITFKNGSGAVTSASIQNPGEGYTSNPAALANLSGCGSLTLTAVAGYRVSSLTLGSGGSGYTTTPVVTVGGGAGTAVAAATGTATLGPAAPNSGQVSAINLNSGGTGYASVPTVILGLGGSGVGFTTATASANLGITHAVTGIALTNSGSGYAANPPVTFSGGGGTGAAAASTTANGANYGQVFLVTSMSRTPSGARAMAQMEIASPMFGVSFPSALTLGPSPTLLNMPTSNNFKIIGTDANSCGGTQLPDHPAIGGYDNPHANPPTTSVDDIVNALPNESHYIGYGGTPSVENVYSSLGETMGTPAGLKALIDSVAAAPGAHVYGNNPSSIAMGSAASPAINYVDGNLSLGGSTNGYGILVVTGKLTMSGNFAWHGSILVVGNGEADFGGGGNGLITGSATVIKIWDNYTNKTLLSSLGSPTLNWNGGGGNGIQYDHCWSDDLISAIPFTPPPSTKPLKVLSTRPLMY
jgi:hypothetical protein